MAATSCGRGGRSGRWLRRLYLRWCSRGRRRWSSVCRLDGCDGRGVLHCGLTTTTRGDLALIPESRANHLSESSPADRNRPSLAVGMARGITHEVGDVIRRLDAAFVELNDVLP